MAGPLVVGGGLLGGGEKVEEDRGHFVALVPVERWSSLEDLERLSYFPLVETGLIRKDSYIFKGDTVS